MFSARCLCSEKRRIKINGVKRNKADISEINRMHFIGAYGFCLLKKFLSDVAMLYCSVLTMIISYR